MPLLCVGDWQSDNSPAEVGFPDSIHPTPPPGRPSTCCLFVHFVLRFPPDDKLDDAICTFALLADFDETID